MNSNSQVKTKKKLIIEKSIEQALCSTFIGLPNIFRTEKAILKYMWIILFTISLAASIYTIFQVISNYLDYEIITSINVINKIPAEFPAVTLYLIKNNKANFPLYSIMSDCTFNQNDMSSEDFEMIKDELNYTSFKFKPKKSIMDGDLFGLRITFDLTNFLIIENSIADLKVIIHDDSVDSGYHCGYSRKGLNLQKGFDYKISINKIMKNQLGQPYNACLKDVKSIDSFDSDIYRYMIQSTNYSYRQKDCFEYCIGKELNQYLNITNKIELWANVAIRYPRNYYKVKLLKLLQNVVENCSPYCPLECDSITYETSLYSNKIDFKNAVSFSIFYESLEYTLIDQKSKMDVFDLISNIGGNLGLFIGISFLSLAEFIELLIEIIYIIM